MVRRDAIRQELGRIFRSDGFNFADTTRSVNTDRHSFIPYRELYDLRQRQAQTGAALSGTRPNVVPLHGILFKLDGTGQSPIISCAFDRSESKPSRCLHQPRLQNFVGPRRMFLRRQSLRRLRACRRPSGPSRLPSTFSPTFRCALVAMALAPRTPRRTPSGCAALSVGAAAPR